MDAEAIAEMDQAKQEAITTAMERLGLDPEVDPVGHDALEALYEDAFGSGQQMEYSYPS